MEEGDRTLDEIYYGTDTLNGKIAYQVVEHRALVIAWVLVIVVVCCIIIDIKDRVVGIKRWIKKRRKL